MVKLRALTPLSGDYGFIRQGQEFQTDDQRALILESRGLVERVHESLKERAVKMLLGSPENKSMAPTGPPQVDAPVRNTEPPPLRQQQRQGRR